MAGGTGGHVIPGLTIAHRLQRADCAIAWLGTSHGLEASLVPQANFSFYPIQVTGLRGKGWRALVRAPLTMIQALYQAYKIFREVKPDLVIGMGGYASGPGGIIAYCLGKPLLIHEQNTKPGLTNRILHLLAKETFEAFPNSFTSKRRTHVTGNPVRCEILAISDPKQRLADRTSGVLRMLILGGSQGAKAINEAVIDSLQRLPEGVTLSIRHQCGQQHHEACEKAYKNTAMQAIVTGFIDDMAEAYEWADLVIARAGALTVSEIAASGSCSVLIPHPFAVDDHQTSNARYLSDKNAAILLPQAQLSAERLQEIYCKFAKDRQGLVTMAEAARRAAMPSALEDIVGHCLGEKK